MLAIGFVLLAACLVFGGAFVLIRAAKKPNIPKGFKTTEYEDNNFSRFMWMVIFCLNYKAIVNNLSW